MSEVAKNIRKQRARLGVTQEELAERLHVTRQAVSNWETGKNQPDLDMLEAIAKVLGTEPGELFGEGDKAYPRYQRKIVLRVAVLGLITLFILADGLLIAPRLLEERARTFNALPEIINDLAVLPLCRLAAGMLVPAVLSLWHSVRPAGKLRLILRLLPPLLLIPLLLTWLGLLWPQAFGGALFVLTDPSGFRQALVFRVFPILAGLGLYPAWT